MLLVGLTGNIAAGKSTVTSVFSRKGATIVDADVLAREALAPGTPGFDAAVDRWGDAVRAPDGGLDRAALRRIVFANEAEREALNALVHPIVEEMRDRLVEEARERGDRVVVCDIPLLYENNLSDRFHCVVLVDSPRPTRLQRLVRERDLSIGEATAMIDAQMPADAKRTRADYVIENAGSHAQLEQRALDVWRSLVRDAERKRTN